MDEVAVMGAAELAVAVFAGALAALAAVFVALYLRTRRPYLGRAAVFFGLLVPSYVAPLILRPPPGAPEPRGLLLGMVLATWMLLRAGAGLTGARLSPWWSRLVAGVCLVLAAALLWPGLLPGAVERSLVAHLAVVPCGLGAALCLWRHGARRAVEYRVAGGVTAVAFLHSGLHPFVPWLGWYALVGWVVEAALIALMGAGFLMAHFQKLRDEFAQSEERFASFFEAATDLVLIVAFGEGRSGRILEANAAAQGLLGRSLEELRQLTPSDLVEPGTACVVDESDRRLATEGAATCEMVFVTASGGTLPVEAACRGVVVAGEPAVLVVGRDLTGRLRAEEERRRLGAELEEGRRLESLAVLAGGLAHDFRNLLTAILGSVDLALQDAEPGSRLGEDLGRVRRAGQRACELTGQLLASSGQREPLTSLPPPATVAPSGRGVVLVADDEPDLRDVTRLFLERDGWTVAEASGGLAALAALRGRSDLAAMVLDWKMPDLSGDGVLRAMGAEGLSVPVVLMSGYSEGEASAAVAGCPCVVSFLQKPFLRSDMLAAVARAASTPWPPEGAPS